MDTQVHIADVLHGQEPLMYLKCSAAWEYHRKQQHSLRQPRFYKATRDLVLALTTLWESRWHNCNGTAFHEILKAFRTGHWKQRHPKSLTLSFERNVHMCTSCVFIRYFPFSFTNSPHFLPKWCCACTLSHICNHRSCYVIIFLLLSLSALSIWTIIF